MKAEPLREVLRLRRPVPQTLQRRGSGSSGVFGNRCGSSTSLILSSTSEMRSPSVSPSAAEKSFQKRASSTFQSSSPVVTRSRSSSRSAVKS